MISFYKNVDKDKIENIDSPQANCWIHLSQPNDEEISTIAVLTGIDTSTIKDALDDEESAHIENAENYVMAIIDIPKAADKNNPGIYTIPLTIIITDSYFITACSLETNVLNDFFYGKIKNIDITKKRKLMYQLIYSSFVRFLFYLKQIDRNSNQIQKSLAKSMQNKELLELLELQKSLVFFSASLSANQSVVKKLVTLYDGKLSEEEKNILDDVLIENKQAIEMCSIYREIIKNTMDTFSYVINNNQNFVMKFLTAVTIILSIPMVISGWWGMNTAVPYEGKLYGFWIAISISVVISIVVTIIMWRKKMF